MSDTVVIWMGRDIRDLSREELIEALTHAVSEYHKALERASENRKVMQGFMDYLRSSPASKGIR